MRAQQLKVRDVFKNISRFIYTLAMYSKAFSVQLE
jgi:hypothetical protein